jgi:hypothetical protein
LPESPFIHLAIRSSYSLLESMISPKDVKAWCEEHLVPAVAITDRNNLFGALEISLTLCLALASSPSWRAVSTSWKTCQGPSRRACRSTLRTRPATAA